MLRWLVGHCADQLRGNVKICLTLMVLSRLDRMVRACMAQKDFLLLAWNPEALLKLFYLALQNISQKWAMPIRAWEAALNRFSIQFDDRMPER